MVLHLRPNMHVLNNINKIQVKLLKQNKKNLKIFYCITVIVKMQKMDMLHLRINNNNIPFLYHSKLKQQW
jgi:hypothetical protein